MFTVSCVPVSKAPAGYWRRYRALPTLPRELVTLGLMLLVALTLLPVAIWFAGQVTLGDYVRDPSGAPVGGFWAFWGDYVAGIASGSLGHWVAFLGPWLVLMALRLMGWLARGGRQVTRKA
jgi:hypothetical protein